MTARTYDELFEPTVRLTLEQEGRNYTVSDGDTVYLRTPDLNMCVRFMLAAQAKKDAEIDEDSIVWFRMLRLHEQHSVKVPDVASNVLPFRKGA